MSPSADNTEYSALVHLDSGMEALFLLLEGTEVDEPTVRAVAGVVDQLLSLLDQGKD
jgi:uncharacterized protein YuzB (UPF0349 family)